MRTTHISPAAAGTVVAHVNETRQDKLRRIKSILAATVRAAVIHCSAAGAHASIPSWQGGGTRCSAGHGGNG